LAAQLSTLPEFDEPTESLVDTTGIGVQSLKEGENLQ
jgi:hypothetical protein